MEFNVEIVGKTIPLVGNGIETISDFLMYMAKVSNPKGQFKKTNLMKYLIDQKHWSPLDMANIQVEIEAPRDISRQILRHQSARFQEFSQRYAQVQNFTLRELRRQDEENRQNSIDDFSKEDKNEFTLDCDMAINVAELLYNKWLKRGAAKECARVFLPEGLTMSRIYMNGTIRTWYHYLDVRQGNGTQQEHIWVANAIREKLHELKPELF